MLLLIMQQNGF